MYLQKFEKKKKLKLLIKSKKKNAQKRNLQDKYLFQNQINCLFDIYPQNIHQNPNMQLQHNVTCKHNFFQMFVICVVYYQRWVRYIIHRDSRTYTYQVLELSLFNILQLLLPTTLFSQFSFFKFNLIPAVNRFCLAESTCSRLLHRTFAMFETLCYNKYIETPLLAKVRN